MIAQPQQMELDAISESIQKNVKNNGTVKRTENGNILLPEGFPADVGGGVDQYGNVINNMAVPKSYVDSHTGGMTNNILHTIQMNKATSKDDPATSDYYFAGVVVFLNSKDKRYVYEENFDYIFQSSLVICTSGNMYNKDGTLYGEVLGVYPASSNPMIMKTDGTISTIYFSWHCTDYSEDYKKLT